MGKNLDFQIQAACANSGKSIEIALDSDLNISMVTDGADPMFCLPLVPLADTKEASIINIF